MAGISDDVENLRVNRSDFFSALEEVRPAFGVSEEELEQVVQNGIIHYDTGVDVRREMHFVVLLPYTQGFIFRSFCGLDSCLLNRCERPQERLWLAYCCTDHRDQGRRRWGPQLPSLRSILSSNSSHLIAWWDTRNSRRLLPSAKFSLTATRVHSVSS